MKVTDTFANIIQAELNRVASKDSLFAESLSKKNKTLKGCVNYIITQVQKSGKMGFADEEIFNMAIHYYDEDDVKDPGSPKHLQKVVVNHTIDAPVKRQTTPKPKRKMEIVSNQQTLF